jgi:hypothetical protein
LLPLGGFFLKNMKPKHEPLYHLPKLIIGIFIIILLFQIRNGISKQNQQEQILQQIGEINQMLQNLPVESALAPYSE